MKERMSRIDGAHRTAITSLNVRAKAWTTPRQAKGGARPPREHGGDLQFQTQMWQTPATDSFRSHGGDRKDEQGLDQQARLWATPQSRDYKSGEAQQTNEELYGTKGVPLTAQIRNFGHTGRRDPKMPRLGSTSSSAGHGLPQLWPTPDQNMERGDRTNAIDQDAKWQTPRSHEVGAYNRQKDGTDTLSLIGQAIGAKTEKEARKKLNPIFVEWLQGCPLNLSSLAPNDSVLWAAWSFRSRALLRSWCLRAGLASARSTSPGSFD